MCDLRIETAKETSGEEKKQIVFKAASTDGLLFVAVCLCSRINMGSTASSEAAEAETLWLDRGKKKSVGKLTLRRVPHPQRKWPMRETPYVFISHTGHDNVKEEIARPTHWFSENILKVDACLDAITLERGKDKVVALVEHAYQCTHALVILSPSFQTRKFCVKELNTFMDRLRWHNEQTNVGEFHVIPALWLMDDPEGFHESVQNMIQLCHETRSEINFMVQTVWPELCRRFGAGPMPGTRELEENLLTYVQTQVGGPNPIPPDLLKFGTDRGLPGLTGVSSDSSSASSSHTDSSITGVMFSRVYKDEDDFGFKMSPTGPNKLKRISITYCSMERCHTEMRI